MTTVTHRTIDGKRFNLVDTWATKAEANRHANNRRKQGLLVRVIKLESAYTLRYGIFVAGHK